jgi:hypothetical protein
VALIGNMGCAPGHVELSPELGAGAVVQVALVASERERTGS